MTNSIELLRSPLAQAVPGLSRYGEIPFDGEIAWNDCLSTILSHFSVRSYLSDPLPPLTLKLLVAAAQSAATSANLQSWSVVAIEDRERKEELSRLAGGQAHIKEAPLFLVWLADLARVARVADSRGLNTARIRKFCLPVISVKTRHGASLRFENCANKP